jgi:hypothetical protein
LTYNELCSMSLEIEEEQRPEQTNIDKI